MKYLRKIGIAVSIIVIALLCVGIIRKNFDADEAAVALGEVYDLTEDWTITFADGDKISHDLPYTISNRDSKNGISLTRELSEDYAGLALSFYAQNAALRVFVDGKPVAEAGFTDDGYADRNDVPDPTQQMAPGGQPMGEGQPNQQPRQNQPRQNQPAPQGSAPGQQPEEPQPAVEADTEPQTNTDQEPPAEEQHAERKSEAGEVLIDLPSNLENSSILIINLEQVNPSKPIIIHGASVAERDVSVLGIMRSAVFPLICCLIIVMASVVLVMLDVMRRLWHQRTRGLIYMALFAVDAIVYCFIRTDILIAFFGNKGLFSVMENVCYVLMPVILLLFYGRGFRIHFPKRFPVMMAFTVCSAIVELALEFTGLARLFDLSTYTLAVQLAVIALIFVTLFQWRRTNPEYSVIWLDIVALCCLTVSVLVNPAQEWFSDTTALDILKDIAITAFFLFTMGQHVHIVLTEYRERMAKNAKIAIAANEAKGKFLANMSHEIRTPINAVLGMDEMILRESKEKTIKGYAQDIYSAGQTLLSLINDILDFSKIESGKMEIVPVDYDLSSLIHDLSNMISLRAKNKDLKFEVSVESTLPARLFGDDVRIRQVLTNILTNAVKYTPEGTVWFRVSGQRDGENEILHFEIEDTGIGIKEEDLPKLFEEFERIEEERNRTIEGTGLGMNITIQLLSMMESKLQVESVYGKGSKFWFDLTQRVTDETPIGDFESRIASLADDYTYRKSFVAPEAKVLVVDDNEMNRKVFKSLLKPTEIKVSEAGGGRECLELVKSEYFDLIFLDHMMPEMDGIETLSEIKKLTDFPCKGTPIYVLTANAVSGAREFYLDAGFDGFVSKPVVSEKLEEVIREALPRELLQDAPESDEADDAWAKSTSAPPELPVVDGVDWSFAWLHLPDADLLADTFRQFYTLIPVHHGKLAEMYEGLPSEEGFTAYRIQVHGMKSAAALVGIVPLAGMAKILEFAARDGDLDTIRAIHGIFLKEWDSYSEKLRGVFGIGEDANEKEPEDKDVTRALLTVLKEAMDDFDVDKADETVQELEKYRYDDAAAECLTKLKAAVADLDNDLSDTLIDTWLKELL